MVLNCQLCLKSKSAGPRSILRLLGSTPLMLETWLSAPACPWVSSMSFEKVYELWNCMPLLNRLFIPNCNALYQELLSAVCNSIEPQLGLVRKAFGFPEDGRGGKNFRPS